MTGTLYGIGVGPGDPELVTLKALRIVRDSPVLAYPAPEHGDSLARRIMAPHLPGGQTEIAIRMPLIADRFPAAPVYNAAAAEIGAHLAAGRDVAVLCLGDPFLYGSFMYLHARLAQAHRAVVVPGVSSVTAAAAAAGAPLAARNDVLTILPAPLPDDVLGARLAGAEAAAIVKLGRHLPRVRALLEREGLSARARYVEHVGLPGERVLALADVHAQTEAPYFSLVLVHRRGAAWR